MLQLILSPPHAIHDSMLAWLETGVMTIMVVMTIVSSMQKVTLPLSDMLQVEYWEMEASMAATMSGSTITGATAASATSVFPTSTHTISNGAVAGVALGAAVGGVFLFVSVAFFIWRHRTTKKRRGFTHSSTEDGEPTKPQLHSDSHEPLREELLGPETPRKIREIGGLNEIEYSPVTPIRSEMTVNEATAMELRSDSNPLIDWLALMELDEARERYGGQPLW